jgi:hypothetical protein
VVFTTLVVMGVIGFILRLIFDVDMDDVREVP